MTIKALELALDKHKYNEKSGVHLPAMLRFDFDEED